MSPKHSPISPAYLFAFLDDLLTEFLVHLIVLKDEDLALRLDQFQQRLRSFGPLFPYCAADTCRQDGHVNLTCRRVHCGLLQRLLVQPDKQTFTPTLVSQTFFQLNFS